MVEASTAVKAPVRPMLTHMGINVRDLECMARFYKDVLGLLETDRGRGITIPTELIFLSSDPAYHHQFVLSAGRTGADASTVNQISFLLPSLADLRTIYQRTKAYEVTNLRSVCHGNAWSIYFEDPEANTIEVYVDTPWYVSQPFAKPLDLSLSEETIFAVTERLCRDDPQFTTVAQWRARMRAELDTASTADPAS